MYRILVSKSEGKRPLGKSGIDRRLLLSWMFKKQRYK